jgi:isopentenyl-diphosphate Delta-isomerase
MTEYFDVVDEQDNVIGRASRLDCHANNLLHRSVMFFIFDEAGRVLVNKRSQHKEFFGGLYSIVLGGHVSCGDTYDETVVREAKEEAEITSKPFRMGFFRKRLPQEGENVTVYGFVADRHPNLLKDEIEWGRFMSLEEAKLMISSEEFIPETAQLLPILEEFLSKTRIFTTKD